MRRWAAEGTLLAVALIWGATFFMVKDATRDFSVLAFLALRFTLASLVMLPLVLHLGRWPRPAEWRWGLIAGLILALSYISQTFALRGLGAGRTGFLTGLYVILVPFFALVLLRHRLQRRVLIGAGCAVIGLALLSGAPGGDLLGDGLALACAALYALQILAVERFPADADWRIMALLQLATVAVVCGALLPILAGTQGCSGGVCSLLAPFADPLPSAVPLPVFTSALFTGIAASSVALSVQVWAQRILPPSDAAVIYAMESPFAALFGIMFEGETLTIGALLGCALMLAGMLITSLGGSKARKREAPEGGHLTPSIPLASLEARGKPEIASDSPLAL